MRRIWLSLAIIMLAAAPSAGATLVTHGARLAHVTAY